ncbi:MAG: GIY-YIG nuclease family protein [Bacteroidota bacterium]|nr:GIY-YIG nuclease family protein [Bacteroidota bacterium]
MTHNYFVYITTNFNKTVLYTGVTNDLARRIEEHKSSSLENKNNFTAKYKAFYLIYWERFQWIQHAIAREKEIKGWSRMKKLELIKSFNPELRFLNDEIE